MHEFHLEDICLLKGMGLGTETPPDLESFKVFLITNLVCNEKQDSTQFVQEKQEPLLQLPVMAKLIFFKYI